VKRPAGEAGPTAPEGTGGLSEAKADQRQGVWSPERRRLTAGLVLTVTLVAFESLAVSTVMPEVRDDLGGLGLYGWVFSAFFLGTLVGAVMAGRSADRLGTAPPFVLGLSLFAVGVAGAGAAPSMAVLVGARVVQGLGAGAIPAIAYTSVGRAYPPTLRPRVFAVFSSAWIIPGLIGPAAASALANALSWRAVFWAILPLVALAAVMTLPALRATDEAAEPSGDDEGWGRVQRAVVLAVGAGLVLAGTTSSSTALAVALVAVGFPLAGWAFVRLVPEGTLRAKPGLPAAIAIRGLVTFAFFGTDSFIPLAVTDARGQETWVAGLALTGATLGWTAAAWVQQHRIHIDGPRRLVTVGLLILAAGLVGAVLLVNTVPVPIGILLWSVAGFGVGLVYAPISVTVLGTAPPGGEGTASASMQLCDVLGVALGTGVTGALVNLGDDRGWEVATSLSIAFAVTTAVALVGAVIARRLPEHLPR
jgi:MFS family permease